MDRSEGKDRKGGLFAAVYRENRQLRIFLLSGMALALLLFPLLKVKLGVDLADSGYSLGNYLYPERLQNMWYGSTWLANLAGSFLTALPGGQTLPGIRAYCGLFYGLLAVIVFFFCIRVLKYDPLSAFLGELTALGLCWCPAVILYNTLTYVLFTGACMLLYIGLIRGNRRYLGLAGALLGANIWVRMPNALEAVFILGVVYAVFTDPEQKGKRLKALLSLGMPCVLGCLACYGALFGCFIAVRGSAAYGEMLSGILSVGHNAAGYSLGDMALSALSDAFSQAYYFRFFALLWAAGAAACFLIRHFAPREKAGLFLKRIFTPAYLLLTVCLFAFLSGRGFFTPGDGAGYFNLAVMAILMAFGISLFRLFSAEKREERLFAFLLVLGILVLPFGGNNHLYAVIGCMFLIAPALLRWGFWGDIHAGPSNRPQEEQHTDPEARKPSAPEAEKRPDIAVRTQADEMARVRLDAGMQKQCLRDALKQLSLPVRCFCAALSLLLFFQAMTTGALYAFGDAPRQALSERLQEPPFSGTRTTPEKAAFIRQLKGITEEAACDEILLYGDMPGLSWYLGLPCAISSSWPNLESYPAAVFASELKRLKAEGRRPLVVVAPCNEINQEKEAALDAFLAEGYEEIDAPAGVIIFVPVDSP